MSSLILLCSKARLFNARSNGYMAGNEKNEHWHLDKRVPVSIIAAMLFYAGTALWWAATIDGKFSTQDLKLQTQTTMVEANTRKIGQTQSSQSQIMERLARIEERASLQIRLLTRIEESVRGYKR